MTQDTSRMQVQWYRGRPSQFAGRDDLAQLLRQASSEFGQELRVDNQHARLAPGQCIGVPVWQGTDWAVPKALLLCTGEEPLLEVRFAGKQPVKIPPGRPVHIGAGDGVRFHPATREQHAELVLARPAVAGLGPPLRRLSARVFTPAPGRASATPLNAAELDRLPRLHFDSRPRIVARVRPATAAEVAEEPVFEACGLGLATAAGGPLLRRFVEALPAEWRAPGADVRVGVDRNELSPGWNPCAVAFHMDGTSRIRNRREDGQPDLQDPGRTVEQILACFGPAAPTRFLVGPVDLPLPPVGDQAPLVAREWARLLEEQRLAGTIVEWHAPPDTLIAFGHGVFHTGSTSRVPGWRCFVKAMRFRGDPMPEAVRPREHDTVSWPFDAPTFPTDPCGVFPEDLP